MSNRPSTLQDFPYSAGLQAIKDSLAFDDFDAFYRHLLDGLPQNSPETRRRYASLVTRWFFPHHELRGLLPRVWQAYHDDQLLHELTRVTTLEMEPLIARFVTDVIFPISPGQPFQTATARDYVVATYGIYKKNSRERLLNTVRLLGFLARYDGRWVVAAIPRPANALLVLLHARLAPTPRIVRVADLLAAPFWQYLGFRQADEVRAVLHDAQAAGLIARYTMVDQLEQITTKYTLDAYLETALRL
ncbi:MAG: hypothetical protein WBW48_17865 [Anaerolineae bacterium]